MRSTFPANWAAVASGVVLVACGGGGGSDTPAAGAPAPAPAPAPSPAPSPAPAPAPIAATTIAGSAVKGPVANSTVTIKDAATGTVLGTAGTGADGAYSLSVPTASGDVIVEVTSGSYVDEASGANSALTTPLRSVVTANGGTVAGIVTPLTTLAYTYAFGAASAGVTASAFNTRAASLATQFQLTGVNLATTLPVTGGGSVNTYGQVLRGLSQYMLTNNVTLATFVTTQFTASQWAAFSAPFTSAYQVVNPGAAVSFNFTGTGVSAPTIEPPPPPPVFY